MLKERLSRLKENLINILSNWGWILFFLIFIIPLIYLFVFIHEMGHYTTIRILGWELSDFIIGNNAFFDTSYVSSFVPNNASETQRISVYLSGSLSTLLVGLILFFILIKYSLNKYIEALIFMFSILLITDFLFYNIIDVFIYKEGDWWHIYQMNSYVNFIFLLLSFYLVYLVTKYSKPIGKRIEF